MINIERIIIEGMRNEGFTYYGNSHVTLHKFSCGVRHGGSAWHEIKFLKSKGINFQKKKMLIPDFCVNTEFSSCLLELKNQMKNSKRRKVSIKDLFLKDEPVIFYDYTEENIKKDIFDIDRIILRGGVCIFNPNHGNPFWIKPFNTDIVQYSKVRS